MTATHPCPVDDIRDQFFKGRGPEGTGRGAWLTAKGYTRADEWCVVIEGEWCQKHKSGGDHSSYE